MNVPDEDTTDMDMVSPTPPPQQVSPDGSRPPPVAGGAAEPKESESPPTTITTPELDLPAARTLPLPSTSTTLPDEPVPSSQVSNLDMFKDDDIDLEDLMVAECSYMTRVMRKHIISVECLKSGRHQQLCQ